MRTSFQRHSSRRSGRLAIFGVTAPLVLLLYFFSGPLGSATSLVAAPFEILRAWFLRSEALVPSYVRSLHTARIESDTLREKVEDQNYNGMLLTALEEENRLLRRLEDTSSSERILAGVVRRPSEMPYDVLIVDKGKDDGVSEGALVFADRTVIGTVERAYPKSSLVMLFSTPGVTSPVFIYGPDIFARAVGQGGGLIRVGVPQGIVVSVGDPVIVPVSGNDIYGLIEYIESDPSNPEQYAYVAERPTLGSLRFVLVDPMPVPQVSQEEALSLVERVEVGRAMRSELDALTDLLVASSSVATTTRGGASTTSSTSQI